MRIVIIFSQFPSTGMKTLNVFQTVVLICHCWIADDCPLSAPVQITCECLLYFIVSWVACRLRRVLSES